MNNQKQQQQQLELSNQLMDNLPDSLLCSIISLLPFKEAVKTSVVARRWRPLWRFVTCVDFDMQQITNQCKECCDELQQLHSHPNSSHLIAHAILLMERIISTHQTKITSCQILFPPLITNHANVNYWIGCLIKRKGIRELTLMWKRNTGKVTNMLKLELTSGIFSRGTTLNMLDLTNFKVGNASQFKGCENIATLNLNSVLLTDNVVEEINQWKLLESLSLSSCTGITKLKICVQNLKKLELMGLVVTEIKIQAKELAVLRLINLSSYCPVNNAAIHTPNLIVFQAHAVMNLIDVDFDGLIQSWELLENLSLSSCNGIRKVKICHQNLKVLELHKLEISAKNMVIKTPNLVVFHVDGIDNFKDEDFDEIIRNPNLLENISLSDCIGITKVKVFCQNLKVFELKWLRLTQIQICAKELSVLLVDNVLCPIIDTVIKTPNLTELRAYCKPQQEQKKRDYLLETSALLRPADILSGLFESQHGSCYRTICPNLRTLSINLDLNNIKEITILSFILRVCSRLEKLDIRINQFVSQENNAILVTGVVESPLLPPYKECMFWDRQRQSSDSIPNNLRIVEIHGYRSKTLEYEFFKHLITKAPALENISIQFYDESSQEDVLATSELLLLLPRASINVSIVFIMCCKRRKISTSSVASIV